MRTALDTSVIVAAMMSWHAHHGRAGPAVAAARSLRPRLVIPVPALMEAYSVMTRLPRGYRMDPQAANQVLHDAFANSADLIALDGDEAWSLVTSAADGGFAGGIIHDADILRCAEKAGAKRLLTLNPKDFLRFGSTAVAIVEP